jgi:micrococcal nuclease
MDNQRYFLRLFVTVLAVILIMFLAKIWFINPSKSIYPTPLQSHGLPDLSSERSTPKKTEGDVISWQDAAKHYGEYATVEGTIVATHNSGKACFLNFHPDYNRYFTAVIFASAFSRFPPNPEMHYRGRNVRVSGYIKEYKGKPEIILEDPSQIVILN